MKPRLKPQRAAVEIEGYPTDATAKATAPLLHPLPALGIVSAVNPTVHR